MPFQGCCSPILGADMNITQGRMIFILIRGIRGYTVEHMFKLEEWESFTGGMTFELGLEASIEFSRGQGREQIFKIIYVRKHKDFKVLSLFKINAWSPSLTRP